MTNPLSDISNADPFKNAVAGTTPVEILQFTIML